MLRSDAADTDQQEGANLAFDTVFRKLFREWVEEQQRREEATGRSAPEDG